MASTKKITLKSSDNEKFDVDEAVALQSEIIKHMIEVDCADNEIPVLNVTGKILAKVIEFCKKHVEMPNDADDRSTKEELKKWATELVNVNQRMLFHLILAANYLDIKSLLDFLLDLICQTVADKIKGRTPDEIRKTFNIVISIPSMASTKKITLKSSDDEIFNVDEAIILQSVTIKHMIEDNCADNAIPLPNVTGKILAKVIEFCKKHIEMPNDADDRSTKEELKKWATELVNGNDNGLLDLILAFCKRPVEMPNDADDRSTEEELKKWDTEFVKVDQVVLFDLIRAANYLNIKSLLELTCQTVADMIKGKTPEAIRKTFNLKSDRTPEEEEEEVRRENQWAFE